MGQDEEEWNLCACLYVDICMRFRSGIACLYSSHTSSSIYSLIENTSLGPHQDSIASLEERLKNTMGEHYSVSMDAGSHIYARRWEPFKNTDIGRIYNHNLGC